MPTILDIYNDSMLAGGVDTITNSNIIVSRISREARYKSYKSAPWTPPVYSSLTAWMIMNYSLLASFVVCTVAVVIWAKDLL